MTFKTLYLMISTTLSRTEVAVGFATLDPVLVGKVLACK